MNSPKRRYFGTDGIRGKVGEWPLTPEFVLKLGWAVAKTLQEEDSDGLAIIGKDTRRSGYMFESALEAGFSAAGMEIRLLGPLPTPGIAHLTRTFRATVGVVISASHNPYDDNGIKFFAGDGRKLADNLELQIETALQQPLRVVTSAKLGVARRVEDARGRYIEFCKSVVHPGLSLEGMKLVIDCANGATYDVAPHVFSELGADIDLIGDDPDGLNINQSCGSVHPSQMIERVRETGADYGIAFDGDGDRVVMTDAEGTLFDGDDLIYVIAKERLRRGQLKGPVVGTLMSNLGLEQALGHIGIPFERAAVGDRYVLERMEDRGSVIGGETSGHILCLDKSTSGDGVISALSVLDAVIENQASLADLTATMIKRPQILRNIPVREDRFQVMQDGKVTAFVREVEEKMKGQGRVLLRASGTEPVIRVMVEGPDLGGVTRYADAIVDFVKQSCVTDVQ